MNIINEAASERAEKIGRQPFADNAPPVNYCGELHKAELEIYGALRGIRDDFKNIVGFFRRIQDFDKRLIEAIQFSLPKELNGLEEIDGEALNAEMSDEGFAKALRDATAKTTNVSRMGAYVEIANALSEAIDGLKRKEAKLTERMKLQHNTSPEWKIACDRRAKMRDAINVLMQRRQKIAGLFFDVRKRVAQDIAATTKAITRLFTDEKEGIVDAGYIEAMARRNTEPLFEEIAKIGWDARLGGGAKNYAKRKGWKA